MRSSQRFFWSGSVHRSAIHVHQWAAGSLCLLLLFLAACDNSTSSHHQTVQTDNGSPITYSDQPQDVLVRLFYGGGKVGTLEMTPEISIYGDGTFIVGPGLKLRQGSLSSDTLQNLLHTLTSTNNLLQLHRQIFDDIPGQNATLLQINLNGQKHEFVYGPFGNLQESTQDIHEYQQLGNAISTIKNVLNGSEKPYTSRQMALLVYQTFRADYGAAQNQALPIWPLTTIDLANTAIYECGSIPLDQTGPNADNGCLTYTVPLVAYLPTTSDLQQIKMSLLGQITGTFLENNSYYVVILRPLLPDEITQQQLAMFGSNDMTYKAVPMKGGAIPTPTPTP